MYYFTPSVRCVDLVTISVDECRRGYHVCYCGVLARMIVDYSGREYFLSWFHQRRVS